MFAAVRLQDMLKLVQYKLHHKAGALALDAVNSRKLASMNNTER